MNRSPRVAAMALAAALPLAVLPAATGSATDRGDAPQVIAFGLTDDDKLIRFDVRAPGDARSVGEVTGLAPDAHVVGIDFRPANGRLYALGDAGGIYTVDLRTAEATRVSQLTVPLEGDAFGVDFNPAADRLRVVSNIGQNLRHDVNPGGVTIADGPLNTLPEGGVTRGVTSVAYTNNDQDPATGTSLFDVNTRSNQVLQQVPPNNGTLVLQGPLGRDAGFRSGLDVFSPTREGRAVGNRTYAVLRTDGRTRLFTVQLLTGATRGIGGFPRGVTVWDLAVRPQR